MAQEPAQILDDPDLELIESTTGSLEKRMRHMKKVMEYFWSRWQKEYVPELTTAATNNASKFSENPSDINVGNVVVVYDKEQPHGFWKTGVIEKLHEGADGKIQGANIRAINSQGKAVMLRM